MLGFIIPLKSQRVARDWDLVTQLLERTLRSACAQTHPGFFVVVVCHEVPNLDFRHPQVELCPVGFDPPGPVRTERIQDKTRKLYEGLQRIRETDPSHVMALDSDDLVSKRLAAHVATHPAANGWYLRSGYIHSDGVPTVHLERRRFHQWCGSSHILKLANIELGAADKHRWLLRHRWIVARQRDLGTPLRPLPFPGAVYNVSHGENFNDYAPILWPRAPLRRLARRLLYHRPITTEMRDEFGLYSVRSVNPSVR